MCQLLREEGPGQAGFLCFVFVRLRVPDIGPGASAFPHAGAPHALRMKELLEAVRDERDKMIGTRDVLQRSMVL